MLLRGAIVLIGPNIVINIIIIVKIGKYILTGRFLPVCAGRPIYYGPP